MLTAALTEPSDESDVEYDSDSEYDPENDPYEKEIYALKYGGVKWSRRWRDIAMKEGWGQPFIDAHIEE